MNRCDSGGARTRARRHGLAHAALAKSHLDFAFIHYLYQFNVHPILEGVIGRNLLCYRLPAQLKLLHVNYEMRIAHGHRNAGKLSVGELDGKLISYLRLAHGTAKLEAVPLARGQVTGLQAGTGTNDDRAAIVL